ncbi:MAG: Asp-tRNA(Asn)/Glu-tRNA(Gln) amidotransferase subunit GatA [Pseudomonadota bacterium]|nr:Asp-tRNA(Asn)/Glu-tRNA(Gln) amidotransferase subunit GatA [Pseudomonadota bacterium]
MNLDTLLDGPLRGLAGALARREVQAAEVARAYLDRIAAANALLNCFITVDRERSLHEAEAADRWLDARAAGGADAPASTLLPPQLSGLLAGVPVAHKDIFCAEGWRTTCGSRMLENFVAPYDAHVITRFRAAGAVTLGRANMDEFAMGSSNENSWFGPVRNPWDTSRVPGGSSGGSAAAVAAGLAPAATGTDTGGSIRQPAAWCGVSGIKPTYGRVSRYGMIAFASSLDQGGAFARRAEDLALLLDVMAGHDARDATSAVRQDGSFTGLLGQDLTGLRVGVPRDWFGSGLAAGIGTAVQAALEQLQRQGCVLVDIDLPASRHAIPAYYVIAPAECSSNLSRFDGVRFGHRAAGYRDLTELYERSRAEGFGAEVKRRILIGSYVLSHGYYDAYYLQAQKVRRLIADDFTRAFASCDLIAGPVTPTSAFRLGACNEDPVQMYLEDMYTIPVNLAGLPGMSIPAGFDNGLPVGLQLIGPWWQEARLLQVAHAYQQHTDWHRARPAGVPGVSA